MTLLTLSHHNWQSPRTLSVARCPYRGSREVTRSGSNFSAWQEVGSAGNKHGSHHIRRKLCRPIFLAKIRNFAQDKALYLPNQCIFISSACVTWIQIVEVKRTANATVTIGSENGIILAVGHMTVVHNLII